MKIKIEMHELDPLLAGLKTTVSETKKVLREKKIKSLQKAKERIEKKLSEE